jgi:hypothetical protein
MSTQLPLEKYTELWEKYFEKIAKQTMPSYNDYIIRHNFFEEYLKSFGGTKVRYILVAEAAPFHDVTKLDVGAYFYNFKNEKGLKTRYFSSPCGAFDVKYDTPLTPEIALKALQDLAKKGVLLLDLFPFAFKIDSTLRKKISGGGILKHFWEGEDYSIKTQIMELCTTNKITLDLKWDLCLIAPPLISCHLVGAYNELTILPFINGNHNRETFKALNTVETRRGCDHKKVASDTSGNPNAKLIGKSFNIIN